MKELYIVLISAGAAITGALITFFSVRRKNEAEAADKITAAANNVVQTMLEEQDRQRVKIEHLEQSNEHLTTSIHKMEAKLRKIAEFILAHPDDTIPKSLIANLLNE
jgi:hypothetical protein